MTKKEKLKIFDDHSSLFKDSKDLTDKVMTFEQFAKAVDVAIKKHQNPGNSKIDFKKMLEYINLCTGRGFKVINSSVRKKMNARIREGYSKQDIVNAIQNACATEYHRENGFQHLTPEFFSRSGTLDKYSTSVNNKKIIKKPQDSFKNNIPVE